MDDYDIDPYYDNGSGSGANLVPMRRNTGPSENMFVAHTNMKKVVEGNDISTLDYFFL
jgi:hypothetical protein